MIDIINRYSNISNFVCENYDYHGNAIHNIDFFYEYLKTNRKDLENILALLQKLKELKIYKIELDENLDFSKETLQVNPMFNRNSCIEYLDNLEVVPHYDSNTIKYQSNASIYKIILERRGDVLSDYNRKIMVNSLLFSPNRLPHTSSKETTFDNIINLSKQKQYEYSLIKDSVDLSFMIYDFSAFTNHIQKEVQQLSNVEKKEELVTALKNIRKELLTMQSISDEYDQYVSEKNPDISKTFLEEEKKTYQKKRYVFRPYMYD